MSYRRQMAMRPADARRREALWEALRCTAGIAILLVVMLAMLGVL